MKKKTKKKVPATEPINVEVMQENRMEAITNLSRAILETARALNTPSVMIRNNTFIGGSRGSTSLTISQRGKK